MSIGIEQFSVHFPITLVTTGGGGGGTNPGVTGIAPGPTGIDFSTTGGGTATLSAATGGLATLAPSAGGPHIASPAAEAVTFATPVTVVGLARTADQLIVLYVDGGENRFVTVPLAPGVGPLTLTPAT